MKFLNSIIRAGLAPVFAGLIALIYFGLVGFRGFGASTLDWLYAGRRLAHEVLESPRVALEWSASTHSFGELIAAAVYLITPSGASEWALFAWSILAGALATAMIFVLSRRLAGPIGGWISLFFVLTCAPWMGLFTRVDPTFLLVPVLLGAIMAWQAKDLRWWVKSLICAPLLAVSTLLWTGTLVVLGLLLTVELISPARSTTSRDRGLIDGPTIELDRFLTPVLALGLLLLYPLFWPAPIESLGTYFLTTLESNPAAFVFRGDAYPPARPPLYTGGAWIFEQLPLAMVIATCCGILWCLSGVRTEDRRLALSLAVIAAALLVFPVLFRNPRPLGAEFGVLFIATAVPVASLVTCRFFAHALGPDSPSPKARQVAIATFLLAGISILIEAPRAMESPETFRSPMTARLTGWSAGGDMPLREDILPRRIIEISGADQNARLYSGGWERYLDVYERMGLLDDIQTTAEFDEAAVAIRPVPPVAAGRFSIYPATHLPAFDDSQTVVVPDIHRPLFLIDQRDAGVVDGR